MSKSSIEWTDETWNPVTGCTKVSLGCKHCYAERQWPRMTRLVPAYAGRDFTDVRCHPERLEQPLRWKRPRKVFVNSMSDLFHPDVPNSFIDRVFAVMAMAPQHTFQILTKRPDRMRHYFAERQSGDPWAGAADDIADMIGLNDHPFVLEPKHIPLRNVWLGVSIEDQPSADERIIKLLETPAAVRFISAEPLLGSVNAGIYLSRTNMPGLSMMPGFVDPLPGIDWVIVGGESGPNARPMHPDWVRSLRDQCAIAGVPFLFKQWGEYELSYDRDRDDPDCRRCDRMSRLPGRWINLAGGHGFNGERVHYAHRVGKKAAGRLLDGIMHNAYPEATR